MKKALSLILALALVFALAGCSSSNNNTTTPATTAANNTTASNETQPTSSWPAKDIRLIVPYSAGGNSDLCARKLAEIIEKKNLLNGHTLVVTNIQGSATQEAFNALMTADPDGYTILMQHNAILTQPAFGNVSFTMEDVGAVCKLMDQPFMIFASGDAPFNTTAELVAYCKDHPGEKITMGVPGVGSSGQIGVEVFLAEAGIRDSMQFVYYPSGGDSLTGHLAGECVLHGGFATDGMRYVPSGELKVIAVSGQSRNASIPDVECFGELGFKTDYLTYQGMWVTKGTPDDVVNQIAKVFEQAVNSDEFKQYCDEQGCSPAYIGPQEWHDLMANLNSVIVDLVQKYGLANSK
ncbi:MAG: tripartite tricarboxylate transporter substrate binding protein [Lachnospiraceae bacterium]|nr:tripartite tricarboxylate transporter substrate binding protein [Lachnospiraceae bacterium]